MHRPKKPTELAKTDGNPEGKGTSGFLLDWSNTEPRGIVEKPHRQILTEFFTSMLVLSAQFKYRPAVGCNNYLYWTDNEWALSLIAPEEWSGDMSDGFVGTCVLQHDMTWTLSPSDLLRQSNPVSEAVSRFYEAFADTLDSDLTLEEILPFYVSGVGYYQRLFAAAMSRSVRKAVIVGGQHSESAREWKALLPRLPNVLPPAF